MRLRAVLFDIDGTLVDSNEDHVTSWAFAFREEGHPQETGDIRAQIGKGGDLLIPALLPEADDAMRERLAKRHGEHFKESYLYHVKPFDRAADLVRKVHTTGRKVVLASSAKQDEIDHYVDLLQIEDYLEATTSIDDVESSKPEPDIFGRALEKVGVAPGDAVVVGDTPYDVQGARRAGILAIGLTSGPFDETQMRAAGATAVFKDVAEMLRRFDHSPLAP